MRAIASAIVLDDGGPDDHFIEGDFEELDDGEREADRDLSGYEDD